MNMKRNLLMTVAFLASTHFASALTFDELAVQYQKDGYSYIEIRQGISQIKVEAIRNGMKTETIYDAVSGAILKTESELAETILGADPGVLVRRVDRDFVDVDENDDDENDDDENDDDENDDDENDDDENEDDENDDDSDDDNDDDAEQGDDD